MVSPSFSSRNRGGFFTYPYFPLPFIPRIAASPDGVNENLWQNSPGMISWTSAEALFLVSYWVFKAQRKKEHSC
jgi:hypothetical protein